MGECQGAGGSPADRRGLISRSASVVGSFWLIGHRKTLGDRLRTSDTQAVEKSGVIDAFRTFVAVLDESRIESSESLQKNEPPYA